MTRYDGPWEFPAPQWRSSTVRVFLRLLFRAGLLTQLRPGRDEDNAEVNDWANLLFADTVAETLRNVAAYEQFYGRCEAWPDWLRDRDRLRELLDRELLSIERYSDLTYYSQVIGQWPPPVASRLNLLMFRLLGRGGTRLDP